MSRIRELRHEIEGAEYLMGVRNLRRGFRDGDPFRAEVLAGDTWVPVTLQLDVRKMRESSTGFLREVLSAKEAALAGLVGSF